MSTRAYKLLDIKTERDPAFNVSHSWEFVQKYGRFNNEGYGDILQFDREDIENGLKTETIPEWIEILEIIIKDIDKGEDYVEYYCF